jgi:prophage regulatory protein
MPTEDDTKKPPEVEDLPHARIVRLRTVIQWTGMSRSWIYSEMAAGRFVGAVKIGRATGWNAGAVQAWIHRRFQDAEAGR